MSYTQIAKNWVYEVTTKNGKLSQKLLGYNCPHCKRFFKADQEYEEWAVDATEHSTYCSPAHQRAMAGERL